MNGNPRVSVLVPVFETDPAHLRAAIASVLAQTWSDFELILLDDSPAHRRESVVREFSDPRIRYERNETNLGIARSRNRLIELSRGEYLAVFDHDDVCRPDRLEKQVAWLDAHPECGVVSSWTRRIPSGRLERWPEDGLELALLDDCVVPHTAAMIRKSLLDAHGIRYREEFSPAEDWGLWLQLLPHAGFRNLPEPLVDYRWFAGNTSHRQSAKMKSAAARVRAWAEANLPGPYAEYRIRAETVRRVRLLGVPVMKFVTRLDETTGYLFNCLPVARIKSKTSLGRRDVV